MIIPSYACRLSGGAGAYRFGGPRSPAGSAARQCPLPVPLGHCGRCVSGGLRRAGIAGACTPEPCVAGALLSHIRVCHITTGTAVRCANDIIIEVTFVFAQFVAAAAGGASFRSIVQTERSERGV